MRRLTLSEVTHRLVREVACVRCYQRPPGSEMLGPEVSRRCELDCPLFVHLPRLIALSGRVEDRPGDCELAARTTICSACRLRPTSGEYCADFDIRECPLSRYAGDVVAGLQRVLASPLRRRTTGSVMTQLQERAVALALNILHVRFLECPRHRSAGGTVLVVAAVYLAWVVATYLLEGARQTFLRPDAQADRLIYAVIANLLAGISLPLWAVRTLAAQRAAAPRPMRCQAASCTAISLAAAALIGLLLLVQLRPVARDLIVVVNVFAQALPTSIAEVVVCWVLAGVAVDAVLGLWGRFASGVAAWLAGAVLFGIYHFAHSPPYTWGMVAGLSGIGLVTGAYLFVAGELYGTVLLHTSLATTGVTTSLANAGALAPLQSPQPLLYLTAAASVVTLAGLDALWFRAARASPDPPIRSLP